MKFELKKKKIKVHIYCLIINININVIYKKKNFFFPLFLFYAIIISLTYFLIWEIFYFCFFFEIF